MGKKAVFKLFYFISILLTFLLAILTVIAVFAPSVSPEKSLFITFIAMGTPVLLTLNVFLVLYWAIRLRFWVWIPLIAILANWNFISAIYQTPLKEKDQPDSQKKLKLSTYNVAHFGKQFSASSCRKIAGFMQDENVDILCLQEFGEYAGFTSDSINEAFRNWPYNFIPEDNGANILKLAVYSKYPITNGHLILYPETQNASIWCDINVNGTMIRLFNNHFQTTNITQTRKIYEREVKYTSIQHGTHFFRNTAGLVYLNEIKRAEQATIIGNLVKESPYPVLLCGDFNSIPASYTYHRMSNIGLKDGFKTAGSGYMYTYRYFKKLLRIDYIFHSPTFKGMNYYSTDLDITSDHNPVIMSLEL